MNIAFYAPLKPPEHPVPSGDRLMARLIIACLTRAGHGVSVAADLRSYLRDPDDTAGLEALEGAAERERARLSDQWRDGLPDMWMCYHPYYKAPDLLGPPLCKAFELPYVTVESSYSPRRNIGIWAGMQAQVLAGIRRAAVNICMTDRDLQGLHAAAPEARLVRLRPFIDTPAVDHNPVPFHLVTIAMMRAGDKMDSYARLAAALALLPDMPWVLSIVGDGVLRPEVEALFAALPADRLRWHGQLDAGAIAGLLGHAALYVWPGCGEAYGLAYLEAQAAGVPVVAYRTAGVPEVVADGNTGLLTPPGDDAAYAAAIRRLLADAALLSQMSDNARKTVRRDHSIAGAAGAMDAILGRYVKAGP